MYSIILIFSFSISLLIVSESMSKDVPIITGIKSSGYRVGDFVNLTCISRAKTAPKLSFTVNDVEVNLNLTSLLLLLL